ncbi:MAG: hypothetical protein ACRER2_10715 [Methylococcales bacterium]
MPEKAIPVQQSGRVLELSRSGYYGAGQRDYANYQEAIHDVTDYIAGFHNSQRLHSTLAYRPPNLYEREMTAKQPISVSEKT